MLPAIPFTLNSSTFVPVTNTGQSCNGFTIWVSDSTTMKDFYFSYSPTGDSPIYVSPGTVKFPDRVETGRTVIWAKAISGTPVLIFQPSDAGVHFTHKRVEAVLSDVDGNLVAVEQNPTTSNYEVVTKLGSLEDEISSNSNQQLNVTLFSPSGLPLMLDPTSGTVCTTEFPHCEIHEGEHFYTKNWVDLGNGATYDILLVTPDTTKWSHLIFLFGLEAEANLTIYLGVTTSANGTALTSFNRNQNSLTAAGLLLFHTPTVTNTGTTGPRYKGGSAQKVGGEVRANNELVLKQNYKILFRFINDTALNNWIDFLFDWYEHTNE